MEKREILKLIDTLSKLKIGVSNDTYHIYTQYIKAEYDRLTTCNDEVYACLNFDSPFKGCVNFNVLFNLLKSISSIQDIDISEDKGNIIFKSNNYETKLKIVPSDSLSFPSSEIDNKLMVGENALKIDEGLLSKIKYSLSYLGTNNYAYTILHTNGICATDTQRLYSYKGNLNISTNYILKIDRKIASFLTVDSIIGIGEFGNMYVQRPDGYAIFTLGIEQFPLKAILSYLEEREFKANNKIINAAIFSDCVDKLSPVLYGEKESLVKFENKDNVSTLTATTPLNGVTELKYDSLSDIEVITVLDIFKMKNIPLDYDLYLEDDICNYVLFKNEDSSILILG